MKPFIGQIVLMTLRGYNDSSELVTTPAIILRVKEGAVVDGGKTVVGTSLAVDLELFGHGRDGVRNGIPFAQKLTAGFWSPIDENLALPTPTAAAEKRLNNY